MEKKDEINKFIEAQGIPGILPTVAQFEDAGKLDIVNAIYACGGVMRAGAVVVRVSSH